MKPSSALKKNSRVKARNAMLMNQLATPGLGSLMAHRWIAGTGQLLLSVGGFVLVMVWFFQVMIPYYRLMFSDTPPQITSFKMLAIGGILFALAWLWSLATSVSLMRAASSVNLQSLESFAGGQMKMAEAQILLALMSLPDWKRNGDVIARTFAFKDFPAAMEFTNAVASLAEQAQHHPDIDVRWNKVTLALSTHDAGGLTQKDFALAQQCDALSLR